MLIPNNSKFSLFSSFTLLLTRHNINIMKPQNLLFITDNKHNCRKAWRNFARRVFGKKGEGTRNEDTNRPLINLIILFNTFSEYCVLRRWKSKSFCCVRRPQNRPSVEDEECWRPWWSLLRFTKKIIFIVIRLHLYLCVYVWGGRLPRS